MFKKFTEQQIQHLKSHKYKSCEYTKLDNTMNKFWYSLVDLIPQNVAPNLITFVGFCMIFSSVLLLYLTGSEFSTQRPGWVILYTVITQFLYQTLDALDGKQARKIGLSTPLGCLFDHGIDVIVSTMLLYQVFVFIGFTSNPIFVALISSITFTGFQAANIIERFTGVLKTNQNGVGVTELQFTSMGIGLISFLFGQKIFQFGLFGIQINTVIGFFFIVFGLMQIFILIRDAIRQGFILEDIIRCFIPIITIDIATVLLFCRCPENITLVYFLIASAFEINTQKMIISNITEHPWSLFHFESIYVLVLSILVKSIGVSGFTQYIFLSLNFCIILSYQATYLYRLVKELASVLDIYVFHVGRPSDKKKQLNQQIIKQCKNSNLEINFFGSQLEEPFLQVYYYLFVYVLDREEIIKTKQRVVIILLIFKQTQLI